MMISEDERTELLRLACSESLRKDMRYISSHRHNPAMVDEAVSFDRFMEFLTQFNECFDHEPRPFSPIVDRNMRL
jgi:hypothetical protein